MGNDQVRDRKVGVLCVCSVFSPWPVQCSVVFKGTQQTLSFPLLHEACEYSVSPHTPPYGEKPRRRPHPSFVCFFSQSHSMNVSVLPAPILGGGVRIYATPTPPTTCPLAIGKSPPQRLWLMVGLQARLGNKGVWSQSGACSSSSSPPTPFGWT